MKKILIIFGTRPEAIKVIPVIKQLQKEKKIKPFICVTAQHRDMLDQVLNIFNIIPDYDLNIMKQNQSLFYVSSTILKKLDNLFNFIKPDLILVQGDTTTAFVASLSAFYKKIPVGHIEAGLRTYDKYNPFPEEINRVFIDKISDLLFVPTLLSKKNLLKEGIDPQKIFLTGNTVIDTLFLILKNKIGFKNKNLEKLVDDIIKEKQKIILVTAHRRENFGEPIRNICYALQKIINYTKDIHIIYPVHPNPEIMCPVKEILGKIDRIHLINPLEYIDFVNLMNKSYIILTDSGGLQEEAPSLGKPVIVLREKTERPEGIKAKTVKIVGTKPEKIFQQTLNLLKNKREYFKMSKKINPYGDGKAGERIVKIIKRRFQYA